MRFNYSPTAFVCLLGAKTAPLHAFLRENSGFDPDSVVFGAFIVIIVLLIALGVMLNDIKKRNGKQ